MNEIEKLYENVGIKPLPTCNNCNMLDEYWSNGTYCSTCKCDKDNDECGMTDYIYPPFTAEKQLELIKWLMKEEKVLQIELCSIEDDFCFSRVTPCDTNINSNYVSFGRARKFEEALADLINDIWQDLTEEEKEQIRGILNG